MSTIKVRLEIEVEGPIADGRHYRKWQRVIEVGDDPADYARDVSAAIEDVERDAQRDLLA